MSFSIEKLKAKEVLGVIGAFFVFVILLALIFKDQASGELILLCLAVIVGLLGFSFNEFRKKEVILP